MSKLETIIAAGKVTLIFDEEALVIQDVQLVLRDLVQHVTTFAAYCPAFERNTRVVVDCGANPPSFEVYDSLGLAVFCRQISHSQQDVIIEGLCSAASNLTMPARSQLEFA